MKPSKKVTKRKLASNDNRFKLIKTFDLVVPEDHDSDTHLDVFKERYQKDFFHFDKDIDSKSLSLASTILTPNQKLKVLLLQLKEDVSVKDCVKYLRSQKALFVGLNGVSLLWEDKKDELPRNERLVSFGYNKTTKVVTAGVLFRHLDLHLGKSALIHERILLNMHKGSLVSLFVSG